MVSGQNTTRKWVGKFCELMDWFLSLEKVTGDSLGDAHTKGLAANYLAVKLGIFDESKVGDTPNFFDREPPYRTNDWQCDRPEQPSFQQIRQWRLERMTHWRHKAQQYGAFRTTPFVPDVTEAKVHRYCDCIEGIIYRASDYTLHGEAHALARQANDLAATMGLTHPDWLLAMDLGLLPHFVGSDEIRKLPLPWDYDKPPVVLRNMLEMQTASDIAHLRESIQKAEALLHKATTENHGTPSALHGIPSEHKSAPLSMRRMAELWGGDMTAKKLAIMIDRKTIHIEKINRQTFVFDTRDLPSHVAQKARQ